ncbi:MAG: hypothetical protein QXH80_01470 [Candidatus Nanoarchaeia archaeon]
MKALRELLGKVDPIYTELDDETLLKSVGLYSMSQIKTYAEKKIEEKKFRTSILEDKLKMEAALREISENNKISMEEERTLRIGKENPVTGNYEPGLYAVLNAWKELLKRVELAESGAFYFGDKSKLRVYDTNKDLYTELQKKSIVNPATTFREVKDIIKSTIENLEKGINEREALQNQANEATRAAGAEKQAILEKYGLKEVMGMERSIGEISKRIGGYQSKVYNKLMEKIVALEEALWTPTVGQQIARVTKIIEDFGDTGKLDTTELTSDIFKKSEIKEMESWKKEIEEAQSELKEAFRKRDEFLKDSETNYIKLFMLYLLGWIDRATLQQVLDNYAVTAEDEEIVKHLSYNANIVYEQKKAEELNERTKNADIEFAKKERDYKFDLQHYINILRSSWGFASDDARLSTLRTRAWFAKCIEDGHKLMIYLKTKYKINPEEVQEKLNEFAGDPQKFKEWILGYEGHDPTEQNFDKSTANLYGCIAQFLASPDGAMDIGMSKGKWTKEDSIAYLMNRANALLGYNMVIEAREILALAGMLGSVEAMKLGEELSGRAFRERWREIVVNILGDPFNILAIVLSIAAYAKTVSSRAAIATVQAANKAGNLGDVSQKIAVRAYNALVEKLGKTEAQLAKAKATNDLTKISSLTDELAETRKLIAALEATRKISSTAARAGAYIAKVREAEIKPKVVTASAEDLAKSAANIVSERVIALFPEKQLPAGWEILQSIEKVGGKETIYIRILHAKKNMGLIQFTIDRSKNTISLGGVELDTLKSTLGMAPEQGTGIMSRWFTQFLEKNFNGWTFEMGEPLAPHTAAEVIKRGGMIHSEFGEQFSSEFIKKLITGRVTPGEYATEISKWKGIPVATPIKIGAGPESMIKLYKEEGFSDKAIREFLKAIGKTDNEVTEAFTKAASITKTTAPSIAPKTCGLEEIIREKTGLEAKTIISDLYNNPISSKEAANIFRQLKKHSNIDFLIQTYRDGGISAEEVTNILRRGNLKLYRGMQIFPDKVSKILQEGIDPAIVRATGKQYAEALDDLVKKGLDLEEELNRHLLNPSPLITSTSLDPETAFAFSKHFPPIIETKGSFVVEIDPRGLVLDIRNVLKGEKEIMVIGGIPRENILRAWYGGKLIYSKPAPVPVPTLP